MTTSMAYFLLLGCLEFSAASNSTLRYTHQNLSTTTILSSNQEHRRLKKNSSSISFYAMADTPYGVHEMIVFPLQIADMDKQVADFAIHLGDMKDSTPHCDQQDYLDMKLLLEESVVPMFIIPGDNDHYDCMNRHRAFHYWQKHLGGLYKNWDLPFEVHTQGSRPENFAFTYKRVLFLSIHSNHRSSIKNGDEWSRIERQNLRWTNTQVTNNKNLVKIVVVFAHAYTSKKHYPVYWDGLSTVAAAANIPFLFLQGDAHTFSESYDFRAKNILRVIVDRGGVSDPLLVTIDPDSKEPFLLQRRPLSTL